MWRVSWNRAGLRVDFERHLKLEVFGFKGTSDAGCSPFVNSATPSAWPILLDKLVLTAGPARMGATH